MKSTNLCFPFGNNSKERTSCFRCCPPIRPKNYDHLQYVPLLKRCFRENRENITKRLENPRPIVGFSCWALGYLDDSFKLIGCLLHPFVNGGHDFRDLTGYGSKCRREACPEAKIFETLSSESKKFWLELAKGLNPFYYSSPKANPLFHLLFWGREVLECFCSYAQMRSCNATALLHHFPFLIDREIPPRSWRLPLELIINYQPQIIEEGLSNNFFHNLREQFSSWKWQSKGSDPYVHTLDIPESLKDFLRFSLYIRRINLKDALSISNQLRDAILL